MLSGNETVENISIKRRSILVASVGSVALLGLRRAPSLTERAVAEAGRLAETMQAIHGGSWTVHIDHVSCLVAVSREFS